MIGLDNGLRQRLTIAPDVLDLVRCPLPDAMLGNLGRHRDPIDAFGQLNAAIGFDRKIETGIVKAIDEDAINL